VVGGGSLSIAMMMDDVRVGGGLVVPATATGRLRVRGYGAQKNAIHRKALLSRMAQPHQPAAHLIQDGLHVLLCELQHVGVGRRCGNAAAHTCGAESIKRGVKRRNKDA